jgi:phage repressor protein C with HTH and peptisase S24 domain
MAQASISELESGASSGTTNIAKFAEALKVSALWLETGRGSPEPREIDLADTNGSTFVSLQWLRYNEMELLNLFRGTDERGRSDILDEAHRVRSVVGKPSAANDE